MPRRKRQRFQSQVPEVNLVPMMDVLMTVLTFFIIISMTLTGQQLADVRLPRSVEGVDREVGIQANSQDRMVVGLTQDGGLVLGEETLTFSQLAPHVRTYFAENPEGTLVLKADRELSYSEVAKLLGELRQIGGNRVSLAVE